MSRGPQPDPDGIRRHPCDNKRSRRVRLSFKIGADARVTFFDCAAGSDPSCVLPDGTHLDLASDRHLSPSEP
jgi:hypothetical protein